MKVHPAIWFALGTVVLLNFYRAMPSDELARCWYAWSFVALAIALSRVRAGIPDEAVSPMVLIAIAASAASLAGDAHLSRLIYGLNIVALLCIVWSVADDWLWRAYFGAGCIELVAFLLGNASRGTFGPEIATSAIGQAYGPLAQPVQLAAIVAVYAVLWYNHSAKKA